MAWKSTVTTAGAELLAAWIDGGGTLSITGAKGGTGAVAEAELYAQTDVSGDRHALTLTHCGSESDASSGTELRVNAKVLPEASAYALRQVGLYGKLMNGSAEVIGETLLALYQHTGVSGMNVPKASDARGFAFELSMALRVGDGTEVPSIQLDPMAFVSQDDLEETLDALHPREVRTVATLYSDYRPELYKIGEWQAPGTTWLTGWQRGSVTWKRHRFTAPEDRYACAIDVAHATADSIVMESWIEADSHYPGDAPDPDETQSGSSGSGSSGSGSDGDEEEIPVEEEIIDIGGSSQDTGASNGIVTAPIEYETMDGWIFLTSAEKPSGPIDVGFLIML